jgi:hypothetical protein
MLTYPQLTHFPIVKRRQRRTVLNRMADGRTVKLADPAGEVTEWRLSYSDLSDAEVEVLQAFFAAAEGSLEEFRFVDPTANLLAWSGSPGEAVWSKGPLLTVSAKDGIWNLRNAGAGPQAITQTIEAPNDFVYCFSLYARAADGGSVRMLAGDRAVEQMVGAEWRRFRMTVTVDDPTFGIEAPPGASVEVRGVQVEAQVNASAARESVSGGVYDGAHLRDDALEVIATGVNRNSCTVKIVHAKHL